MKKIRIILATLSLCSFYFNGWTQLNDTSACGQLNDILKETKPIFNQEFSVLNKSSSSFAFLKQYYKNEFLVLAKDSASYGQISRFIDLSSNGNRFWDSSCIRDFKLLSAKTFDEDNEISTKKNKKESAILTFPIVAVTEPYFLSEGKLCMLGIDYYSGKTSGSFGYYLFEKENGNWKLKKEIFAMLK
jgi:hypothetical protein